MNYFSVIEMLICALARFESYNSAVITGDAFYLIFTCYLVLFAILLGAAEMEYINILKYFEFLFTNGGKGAFLIFVGVLLFDDKSTADLWASITLTLFGIFNLILTCIPLKYRELDDPLVLNNALSINDDPDKEHLLSASKKGNNYFTKDLDVIKEQLNESVEINRDI